MLLQLKKLPTLKTIKENSDRSAAIKRLRGLLTTDRPAPTDEKVNAMLEEKRTEKFL